MARQGTRIQQTTVCVDQGPRSKKVEMRQLHGQTGALLYGRHKDMATQSTYKTEIWLNKAQGYQQIGHKSVLHLTRPFV